MLNLILQKHDKFPCLSFRILIFLSLVKNKKKSTRKKLGQQQVSKESEEEDGKKNIQKQN